MAAARDIPVPQIKILWSLAAGYCSFPACQQLCVEPETAADPSVPTGEMAHIVAHSSIGPRGDPAFPEAKRHLYENLILLCPNCHTKVDKQPNSYTCEDLRKWKADHEQRVAAG